ncbi:MAG: RNA polymerase subunit sigma-24, partial [Sphingomonadales bacterium 32-67-7]
YDASRPFGAWVRRIALNKCRDWARRRRVRAFFTRAAPLDDARFVSDDAVPSDVQVSDRTELARVSAEIALLPARLRDVLLLRTVDNVTQAEAAAILDITEKTVETRLYRARAKLREVLGG